MPRSMLTFFFTFLYVLWLLNTSLINMLIYSISNYDVFMLWTMEYRVVVCWQLGMGISAVYISSE
jgi:hypothetical protein